MNLYRQNISMWLTWILSAALALAALARPAMGQVTIVKPGVLDRRTTIKILGIDDQDSNGAYNVKIGDHNINVDAKHARQGNVYIAKTDTVDDDLVTRDGSITVDGVVEGDCAALGGSITVNGTVDGDVAAFGGSVAVPEQGAVGGKIAAFGGSIDIFGKSKDLACFGGSVELGPKAQVDGDIASMGGTVDKKPGAKVTGEIKSLSFGMLDQFIPGAVHNIGCFDPMPRPPRPFVRVMGFIVALIVVAAIGFLVLLASLFFPRHIEKIADSIRGDFWTSAGVGMLIEIALFPALLLMIVSILGIPLVPVACLLLLAAGLMAYAAFGLVAFRRLTHTIDPRRYGTIAAIMLGYLVLNTLYLAASLIRIVPHLGFLAGLFTAINILVSWFGLTIGLGAVWRTRFGTRNAALPAPPVPPTVIESGHSGMA